MAGGVDRLHAGEPEVPDEIGVDERRDEPTRRAVDVHRDVEVRVRLEPVQRRADVGDRFVRTVERGSEHRDDTDRVLVAVLDGLLGGEVVRVALHRRQAHLDFPVAAELLPADLDVRPHHHVRRVARLPGRLLARPPAPLERHAREHRGLTRTGRRGAGRFVGIGRVPQPAEHVHAALLELRGARVLVLVDHVLVERQGHQRFGLRLHPRRHERREVQPCVPVEHELVLHELERRVGSHLERGELVPGRPAGFSGPGVHRAQDEGSEVFDELLVEGHGRSSAGIAGAGIVPLG